MQDKRLDRWLIILSSICMTHNVAEKIVDADASGIFNFHNLNISTKMKRQQKHTKM